MLSYLALIEVNFTRKAERLSVPKFYIVLLDPDPSTKHIAALGCGFFGDTSHFIMTYVY